MTGLHTDFDISNVNGAGITGTFIRMYVKHGGKFSMRDSYFENITSLKTVPFVIIENYWVNLVNITVVNTHMGSTLFYFFKCEMIGLIQVSFKNIRQQQIDLRQLSEYENKFHLQGICMTITDGGLFSLSESNFTDVYSTAIYVEIDQSISLVGANNYIPSRAGVSMHYGFSRQ